MNINRIKALTFRNLKLTFRGLDPLVDIFYWPLLDLVIWGFTSFALMKGGSEQAPLILLSALVMWNTCYRSNLDVSFTLLNELWSRNIVNLFATPVELKEWMTSAMALGLFDSLITAGYGSFMVWLIYGVNIFVVGPILLLIYFLLLLSGWAIGFFSAAWIVYKGQGIQKIVWVLGWFFAPFSGIFYSLDILPTWAQIIAKVIPMSYTYQILRSSIKHGTIPLYPLAMSIILNCVYLTLSLLFFKHMFHKSKKLGLARLEAE